MPPPRRPGASYARALPLLVGLVVQAATAYVTLILAGRVLGPARFSGISTLYVLITSIATGLYLPFEQEISRRRGAERTLQLTDPLLIARMVKIAMVTSAVVVAIVLVGSPITLRLLNHNWSLVVALCIAIPGYGCCFISRGTFAGTGELGRYGVQLAIEGCFRLVGFGGLALVGLDRVGELGWLFGFAPWAALGVSLIGRHRSVANAPANSNAGVIALSKVLTLLLVSSLASQLLINAGPVVVQLFASSSDKAKSGEFLAALVLVRLPVLIFTAVQPSFLPSLAALAEGGQLHTFATLIRRILLAVLVLSTASTLALVGLGPWLVRTIFDFHSELSRWTFGLAGVSVGLFLASAIIAQALLGLGHHAATVVGWLVGLLGLAVGTALSSGAVDRATSGFVCGAIASTVTLGGLLRRTMSARFPLGPCKAPSR